MKTLLFLSFNLIFSIIAAQTKNNICISTADLSNFWVAYDSIQTTSDSTLKTEILQRQYIDQATDGLKAFIKVRNLTAQEWISVINKYPLFWKSVRKQTILTGKEEQRIEKNIEKFQLLFPALKASKIFFCMGCLRTGGTIYNDDVLIGSEITMANDNTDTHELNKWLQNAINANDYFINTVIHEEVHVQQVKENRDDKETLLGECLKEGGADFIAELISGRVLKSPYIKYGNKHCKELINKFNSDINTNDFSWWLHGGNNTKAPVSDLGYYIGYQICKSYYNNNLNKKVAIKNIIRLNFYNALSLATFVNNSGISITTLKK